MTYTLIPARLLPLAARVASCVAKNLSATPALSSLQVIRTVPTGNLPGALTLAATDGWLLAFAVAQLDLGEEPPPGSGAVLQALIPGNLLPALRRGAAKRVRPEVGIEGEGAIVLSSEAGRMVVSPAAGADYPKWSRVVSSNLADFELPRGPLLLTERQRGLIAEALADPVLERGDSPGYLTLERWVRVSPDARTYWFFRRGVHVLVNANRFSGDYPSDRAPNEVLDAEVADALEASRACSSALP